MHWVSADILADTAIGIACVDSGIWSRRCLNFSKVEKKGVLYDPDLKIGAYNNDWGRRVKNRMIRLTLAVPYVIFFRQFIQNRNFCTVFTRDRHNCPGDELWDPCHTFPSTLQIKTVSGYCQIRAKHFTLRTAFDHRHTELVSYMYYTLKIVQSCSLQYFK